MENQHRKIKGYKDLNQNQIDAMNQLKEKANEIGELLDALEEHLDVDKRWMAIGRTNIQQGMMAATRSITKPDFF